MIETPHALATAPGNPARGALLTLLTLGFVLGCERTELPEVSSVLTTPTSDELAEELDEVLNRTFQRRLNLEDHAAWQILHGALAFQRDFLVEREFGGPTLSAVDHLLNGGTIAGWTVEPGTVVDADTDRRGLRAVLEAGSKSGQGHPDQWFAILAQCGLEPTQPILAGGRTYSMADFVAQVQFDLPRNLDREYSWTLIGLTSYLPTDSTWTALDGEVWSIERLLEIELDQDLSSSACGGTHRLIGVAMALNQHVAQGRAVEGVWSRADQAIQDAIRRAKQFQNPDGSFSSEYFDGPGSSPDLARRLGTTGHVLEFLTLATTEEQLREPWVAQSVAHLCDLFRRTQDLPLECGALYHAAHGLVLYRERIAAP